MNLKQYRQQKDYTCLPACIRIVLAYLGRQHEEEELAEACGSVPVWGTSPQDVVSGLERLGYRALWFENANFERLLSLINQNWPVIAFLRASDMPHGRAGLHAVVVGSIEAGEVITIDPAVGAEIRFSINDFLRVWSALGNQGMVVWVSS